MSGLGILTFLSALTGSAISCGLENRRMKSKPYRYESDGTPVYLDRHCNEYINGEKIVEKLDYKTMNMQKVGSRTGRVYFDEEKNRLRLIDKNNEFNKKLRIDSNRGYLTYEKYGPDGNTSAPCEIATDKYVIAAWYTTDGKYYKSYMPYGMTPKDLGNPMTYAMEHRGMGKVEIPEEEFRQLKRELEFGLLMTFPVLLIE